MRKKGLERTRQNAVSLENPLALAHGERQTVLMTLCGNFQNINGKGLKGRDTVL